MFWSELTKTCKPLALGGSGDPIVTDVVYDSRKVTPGAVYVAITGLSQNGNAFVPDAIKQGAVGIISNEIQTTGTPWIQVADARSTVGLLATQLWQPDFNAMKLAAVTGTNGKTTSAYLLHHLFAQEYQAQSWLFSTVEYLVNGASYGSTHTTPELADICRFAGTANTTPRAIAMEASSHALSLNRLHGILFDAAIFTNLTQDHLDFHAGMEEYYAAKKRLFTEMLKSTGVAIVNIDNLWGKRLAGELGTKKVVTFGRSADATVKILSFTGTWQGMTLILSIDGQEETFPTRLVGEFNAENVTGVIAAAHSMGMPLAKIRAGVATFVSAPGRLETVVHAPYAVVVDYAHTPDALINVLTTVKELTEGRVLCVFGCGGNRDTTKRPLMGAAVARYAHEGYVTSDNPRSEKPEAIIQDIVRGIPLDFPHQVITDRHEAIKQALSHARAGDCVLIAGKGHESYQEIMGVKHHFSDREEVLSFLNTRIPA